MLSITAFWPEAMDHGAVGTYALSTRWYGVTLYGQERHRCIAMEAMHGNRAAQALEFEVVQLVMKAGNRLRVYLSPIRLVLTETAAPTEQHGR